MFDSAVLAGFVRLGQNQAVVDRYSYASIIHSSLAPIPSLNSVYALWHLGVLYLVLGNNSTYKEQGRVVLNASFRYEG